MMHGHTRRTGTHRAAMLVLTGVLALAPAASAEEQSQMGEMGWGLGSAVSSLIYAPVKSIYALSGTLIGGLAWLFSGGDMDVTGPIWTASLRGDYVVTPQHLQGKRTLEFIGRDPAQPRLADVTGDF